MLSSTSSTENPNVAPQSTCKGVWRLRYNRAHAIRATKAIVTDRQIKGSSRMRFFCPSQKMIPANPPTAPVWALIFHQRVIIIANNETNAAPRKNTVSHLGALSDDINHAAPT